MALSGEGLQHISKTGCKNKSQLTSVTDLGHDLWIMLHFCIDKFLKTFFFWPRVFYLGKTIGPVLRVTSKQLNQCNCDHNGVDQSIIEFTPFWSGCFMETEYHYTKILINLSFSAKISFWDLKALLSIYFSKESKFWSKYTGKKY